MKRLNALMVMFLFMGMFFTNFVVAVEPYDTIKSITTFEFMTKIGYSSSGDPLEGFIRMLLVVLLFTVFFWAASLALPKGVSVVIALVISLISAIFIPGTVLVAIASSYGAVVSIAMLAIPVGGLILGFFLLKNHHWIRVVLAAITLWVALQINGHLFDISSGIVSGTYFGGVAASIGNLWYYVIIFCWVILAISLIAALFKVGGSTDHHPNFLKRMFDRYVVQNIPGTERSNDKKHEAIEETRILNDIAIEKQEYNLILAGLDKSKIYQQIAGDEMCDGAEVKSKNHFETLKTSYDNLKKAMSDLKNVDHQWQKAQRKEVGEARDLIKKLAKRGVDTTKLQAIEKKILNDYIAASNQGVKVALSKFETIEKLQNNVVDLLDNVYKGKYKPKGKDIPTPGYKVGTALEDNIPIDLNNLPVAKQSLEKIKNAMISVTYDLTIARDKEKNAIQDTAILADELKKAWTLEPQKT
ncbi:hypothetical protein HYX11_00285 [Candidatus Woesearchaeota archaeon]|nr:hypothetical protein [Candidatus Woesearchaeota archaeon]